ncbi:kinesin-like protein KIN-14F isoform X1 [Typha latifolia]|uniref:kinesin-like protein KIN-14F isoform X1 n=1 Tax=Typha latifolia TaxID=4733 RepID=UPI003C2BD473
MSEEEIGKSGRYASAMGLRCGGAPIPKAFKLTAEESIYDEMALRKAAEAACRRFEAAKWLRAMDQVAEETLPEEPSEEEFRLALRNGLTLCNILNKVNPGAIPKVVESPPIAIQLTDGAAQSAIQYFENMRNFLVAVGEMKLLTFESSDLEKGGSSFKVVDCILCLKGYHEWKLAGGIGIWRYGGIVKITSLSKRLPSTFLESANYEATLLQNQQFLDFVHLLTEVSLEELQADNALSSLFYQFGLRLVQAFFTEWNENEGLLFNEMLGMLLKKMMKVHNRTLSKSEFIEEMSRLIRGNNSYTFSCSKFLYCDHLNASKETVNHQQNQLERLKLSFYDMKGQVESSKKKWEEDLQKLERHVQDLKQNTSSYYKLLEENRLLYNQVQDLKGNIRVYCRVRPFLQEQHDERSTIDHIGENGDIMIMNPQKQGKDGRKIFSFNKVFGANATQTEVFADTQPLVRSVMDGFNVCIFAYGQTGSGKTYTMSGPDISAEETWGVNYRALNDLFLISKLRTDIIAYDVSVQMIEIYNEQVRDLLVVNGVNRRLEIRNNSQLNGLNIPDASLVPVKCTQDVLELMKIGQGNRAVGATALNERSSRSHSVLTIQVRGKDFVSGSTLRGCLHLVDLAGSERVNKSEATGERLREAQHINRSLSALGDVISALAQKSPHIPYRNSKLTQVLQDALGGQAKTLMFVHINPEENAFGETISTLKFAERVASIELGAARVNKETGQVRELKEEISKLKSALESKESQITQLKDFTHQAALEEQRRTRSPPSTCITLKLQGSQKPGRDSRKGETKSWSSGKQSRPRLSPAVLEEEIDEKSLILDGEGGISSRRPNLPSLPLRISLSADRASIVRSRKFTNINNKPIQKLHFQEKMSVSKSNSSFSSVLTSKSLSRFLGPQENANHKLDFFECEKQQLGPEIGVREDDTRKNKCEIRIKAAVQRHPVKFQADTDNRMKTDERMMSNISEIENEPSLVEVPFHDTMPVKKHKRCTSRASQNTEPRTLVLGMEPLSNGKHDNIPLYTQRTNTLEPEIRRSRSLPRGKITLP